MEPSISEQILKLYGPLGLIIVGLAVFIWRGLLPRIDKQQEQHVTFILSALDDARKERDAMRVLREQEVNKFIESLRYRDQEFKSIAEAIREKKSR